MPAHLLPSRPFAQRHHPPPKLLDNLLRDYVCQHYTYDARGNLLERLDNGKKARFTWDLYDRLTRYEDDRLNADFAYDALGRRVAKYSKAHCPPGAGPAWIEQQQRTLNAQYDCGRNIYGWDGDTLAYETRYSDNPGERRLIHYFYEPGSFIPVAQTVENRNLSLVREPSHENGYHIDRDPLWQHQPVAKPFNAMAWYQCDHLGTPMELTDQRGEIAWSGTYQAWGLAKEKRTDSATRENIRNPLRFQGQYFDTETGLHYNRYRYYDPQVGRFISKDPIGFAGGLNVYAYAPNPVGWVDPFGLKKGSGSRNCSCDQSSPPNPDGRRGKESTREHIDSVSSELESRGWNVTHGGNGLGEEYLPGSGGGRKGSSYPDITAAKGDRVLRVNTVDTRRDGVTPTTRESRNAQRIRSQRPTDHLLLIPKPKGK
ncbi:hypothetical protein GHO41_07390 [Pseudomonas sp. FSL R10-0399]|uniref:RHS repeat-associated core domain-containing protein n=1 Tax=Pseudomonas sp. FSL R10-0399 TaxID=2662194 RepID=UPI00129770B0|nr:RHS repeat-associated core domain-containing protein [Pseudomonas sp. FSL R10-0399]MQT57171.1 hypothetical protein [Pseudomonas sp. FSL R10-0399]